MHPQKQLFTLFKTIQQASTPLQDHKTIHNIKDLKNMFQDSLNKIGSMPGEYSIILDPNFLSLLHGRHRVPIEAKEEIETQLREIAVNDIITTMVEPTPWMSSLMLPIESD